MLMMHTISAVEGSVWFSASSTTFYKTELIPLSHMQCLTNPYLLFFRRYLFFSLSMKCKSPMQSVVGMALFLMIMQLSDSKAGKY